MALALLLQLLLCSTAFAVASLLLLQLRGSLPNAPSVVVGVLLLLVGPVLHTGASAHCARVRDRRGDVCTFGGSRPIGARGTFARCVVPHSAMIRAFPK